MNTVRIKICGVTAVDDALAAAELGADFLGFNFYEKSSRFIAPESARAIVERLSRTVTPVGVFVNADRQAIEQAVEVSGVRAIQLHGDEPPELCTAWPGLTVFKAFRLDEHGVAVPELAPYDRGLDWYLIDRFTPGAYGGTGKAVPLSVFSRLFPAPTSAKVFLAGGLTPENVGEAVRKARPGGVDVAGGVENGAPGKKDRERMKQFIAAVRAAEGLE